MDGINMTMANPGTMAAALPIPQTFVEPESIADNLPSFQNEWVEIHGIRVELDSWESKSERKYYRQKAESLLGSYRTDNEKLHQMQKELDAWEELTWKDVFDASSALRGVSYDHERVQTSNISDEPYQIYVKAETTLERHNKLKVILEREVFKWTQRTTTERSMLDLMRGDTRRVAEYLWFDEEQMTWEGIGDKLYISRATVGRERDRAVEIVALYLKRTDFRRVRFWFL